MKLVLSTMGATGNELRLSGLMTSPFPTESLLAPEDRVDFSNNCQGW